MKRRKAPWTAPAKPPPYFQAKRQSREAGPHSKVPLAQTNIVNAAQQVTKVQTSAYGTNARQYLAQNITYTPWGAVSTLQSGYSLS